MGPLELAVTPHNILRIYADAMPELEAEEMQGRILASDMPHADKRDRERVFSALTRLTAPEPEKIDVQTEAGQAAAAMFGIKVDLPVKKNEDEGIESS